MGTRGSSVGIATRYGLDCPGIESQLRQDFPHKSRQALRPHSLLYNGYRDFLGGKTTGAWRWPPTQSSAEVKERVELYLFSPSGPSCPVLGWTLPLHYIFIFVWVCVCVCVFVWICFTSLSLKAKSAWNYHSSTTMHAITHNLFSISHS
jgi:hypothetical protein